jgi:hypothetical protein
MRFLVTSSAKRPALILATILIIGFLLMLASHYLLYSDAPPKSDIIVLFPDPELDEMRREARQLIGNGYSKYLCIPTSFSLYRVDQDNAGFTAVLNPAVAPGIGLSRQRFEDKISMDYFLEIKKECGIPGYFENTHVEMILAKKVMDAYGFKRAIFVSSPFHMRRIKMLAGRVFGSSYDIKLVPSSFEKKSGISMLSLESLQHIFMDYPKIIWLLCYDRKANP